MIVGTRVRLRALEREDLAAVVTWFNDPDTRRTLASYRPLSMADEQRWYDGLVGSQTDAVFIIERTDGAVPVVVGSCGVHRIDWKNRIGLVGIVIGPPAARGQGLGTEAMYLLVKYLHEELGLHRVELDVFTTNHAAIRSYERIGFRREGVRRAGQFRGGQFQDLLLMSVLPGELSAPAPRSAS